MLRVQISLKAIPGNLRRLGGKSMSSNIVEIIEQKLSSKSVENTLDQMMKSLKWPNLSIPCKKKGKFFCLGMVKHVIEKLEVERNLMERNLKSDKTDENKAQKREAQR